MGAGEGPSMSGMCVGRFRGFLELVVTSSVCSSGAPGLTRGRGFPSPEGFLGFGVRTGACGYQHISRMSIATPQEDTRAYE